MLLNMFIMVRKVNNSIKHLPCCLKGLTVVVRHVLYVLRGLMMP